MNCQEFEGVIDDLAGDRLMDAVKKAKGLAHTQTCARCTAYLARERALLAALKVVAGAESEETPARVKAALLNTFAESATARIPSSEPKRAKNYAGPGWRWAAAAAILVLVAIAGYHRFFWQSPFLTAQAVLNPGQSDFGLLSAQVNDENTLKEKQIASVQQPPVRNVSYRRIRHASATDSSRSAIIAKTQEQVTDYIPLTYMNDSTAIQSGVVVRVQIPRATLASMGLPVNAEKTGNLVKADLVIGDDGVTRAIRLVRDSQNEVPAAKITRFDK